jgi:hypothetical protein
MCHSAFRIPHWVRTLHIEPFVDSAFPNPHSAMEETLHLEPFVHSAFRTPHSAFDWYLGPQPSRGDSKLSKPDPKDLERCTLRT